MIDAPLLFIVKAWPVFAAITMVLIPRGKQRSFGLAFAAIGFALALMSAIFLLPVPPVPRILFCAASFLPLLTLLNDAGMRRMAPLFLISSVASLTCLATDRLSNVVGVTFMAFALIIVMLRHAAHVRPVLGWSHILISACITLLTGTALTSMTWPETHHPARIDEVLMAAGFTVLLSGFRLARETSAESALVTMLRCSIVLTAVSGLLKIHEIIVVQEVVIAVSLIAAAWLFLQGCATINLCGCFVALSAVMPHSGAPMIVFTLALCLAENINPSAHADRWMESVLPPSPLLPAVLALFWAMNTISIAFGATLLIIILGQFVMRRPAWPSTLAWQTHVNLWLLLALGLTSPVFIAHNLFLNGVGP
ncbi:hypothetical protein N5W20_08875 [Candidatus Kirkpatrickella diaphorinae]|uniref:Uncharacterized protein n=1 Tax=Candidatus Kirkpatrickella diaphorinae TaxID=2984322 RepID=A0ABY6GJJ0_9PROT|nr:hypothetical protein [Candidatus Kirkpatrickella diaphorinae]UYH51186.1 hypothetical protein N5W20_08875 [Candidatus Kirkpatrickella diaphorinae]